MENRLAIRKPKLSKQWHETKNGKLTPFDVTYSSDKKNCEKGHEWETSPTDIKKVAVLIAQGKIS